MMVARWLVVALAAACVRVAHSCSCSLAHPQTHFCNSDFELSARLLEVCGDPRAGSYIGQRISLAIQRGNAASILGTLLTVKAMNFTKFIVFIVGRVQKLYRANEFYDSYKVKLRNIFKATPKAQLALKSGRILTPSEDSLCGVSLQPRETYVIAGRVEQLQARVYLCGYTRKWRDVTPRQRRGFRLLYKQGCTCKVHMRRLTKSPNACVTGYDECYERHGICLSDGDRQCRWTRAPALTRCLQAHHFNGTKT